MIERLARRSPRTPQPAAQPGVVGAPSGFLLHVGRQAIDQEGDGEQQHGQVISQTEQHHEIGDDVQRREQVEPRGHDAQPDGHRRGGVEQCVPQHHGLAASGT